MSTKRQHPHKALSATRVRALKEPGRYADGGGLYLTIAPSGAKRWVLRTVVHGKRRDIGLGGLKVVSLAEARETAAAFRKTAREGGDPLAERDERRRREMGTPTFEDAAKKVHAEHSKNWRNAKHSAQWLSTLNTYAFPTIGHKRIDLIGTPDILKVLSPIWLTKPETARRIRQRMSAVFDWAKTAGHRSGDNPVADIEKGLPTQSDKPKHHAALPYAGVPDFIDSLRSAEDTNEISKLAFEFLILTASRTGEVIYAEPGELDLENKTWTVPAERMKAGAVHVVPLSDRAVEILERALILSGGADYVFAGRSIDKPLSNMVFLMMLRRMGVDVTAHGFRSSFRDWAAERTNFPREVCEKSLAHTVRDKVEAAYRRTDLLEKRRDLMNTWAAFATSDKADVIPLRAAKQ